MLRLQSLNTPNSPDKAVKTEGAISMNGTKSIPRRSFEPKLNISRVLFIAVIAFPLLVLIQCGLFYVLPLFVLFLTGAAIAVFGIVLLALMLKRLFTTRSKEQALVVCVLITTWCCWYLIPTRDFAVQVRFWFQKDNYEHAVAETVGGRQPHCLEKHECMSDGNTPPYLVFPFPGLLTGWVGIVYVPETNQAPNIERLKSVGSDAGCGPSPISPHYYLCVFY